MKRPDPRPSWRDPNLPVFGKSGRPIDPKKMEQKAQMTMNDPQFPKWRDDPTYNLRRSK